MNTNLAVAGSFHEKLFNYQQFHLRELRIIRGGRAIISLDTTSPCRPYVTTMKATQFNGDFPALFMEVIQNHYILVFDLTSLQDAAEQRKLDIRNVFPISLGTTNGNNSPGRKTIKRLN